MEINGIFVDFSRGFDVMRRNDVIAHFDNYADAVAYASQARNRYVRYWALRKS